MDVLGILLIGEESFTCLFSRLMLEDGETNLYHTLQNSMIYKEKDPIGMHIHEDVSQPLYQMYMCIRYSVIIGC